MENNKINVEETIQKIIKQEGKENGIKLIRSIVNSLAKNNRKKQIRVNTCESIAVEVYQLMVEENYSRVRAIEQISLKKNIAESTINNHLRKFSKIAKENEYLEFGTIADDSINHHYSTDINFFNKRREIVPYGNRYNFSADMSIALYLKYKIDIEKKENRNFKSISNKYSYF